MTQTVSYLLASIAISCLFLLAIGGLALSHLSALQRILNDIREYQRRQSQ